MLWLILVQVVLIALNAIFASAEIAVLQMNETVLERMAKDGNKKAKRLFRLTREPAKFLATIQVAITLSGFLGSALAADNFADPLVEWVISLGVKIPAPVLSAVAVVLITLILSYFTLVFGELVPKRLAMKKTEKIAMGVSGIVNVISVVFRPVVFFLSFSTNIVLRLFGIDPNQAEDEVDEEEILLMVDAGSESGAIESHERELIQNVFDFNDITVTEVATHRQDIIFLDLDDTDDVWLETINSSRKTLYPICKGSLDDIVGILNTKDFFRLSERTRENVMNEAVVKPYFVPGTLTADVLFRNMKMTHNSLAVVVDEYGSTDGIVTFSDLIEELVGEMDDAKEAESESRPRVEKIDDETWLVFGNITLNDLYDDTGIELVSDDYDTITGITFDALGEVPSDGECEITVLIPSEKTRAQITVHTIDARLIERATLKVINTMGEEESTEE